MSSEQTHAASAPTLAEIRSWPATVDVRRACQAIGISGAWGYELLARGEFPCRVIKIRSRTRVVTASLLALLETGVADAPGTERLAV